MAADLMEKVPPDFVVDEYMKKIRSLGGLDIPLNVVLFQEIQRLQRVIHKVRVTLKAMRQAIDGEVVMTQELLTNIGELFNATTPQSWVYTPAGDEFSWISSTVGLWFGLLTGRYEQNNKWLNVGRPVTYWLHGFANPQGFFTSMKQEVTRKHKNDGWSLDDVIYHTEVTDYERIESVGKPPKEGVYVHGLFVDGAAYSRHDRSLVESEPKKLYANLPVLYVSGTTKSLRAQRIKSGAYGPNGPYSCPLYRYPARTDRYYVCLVDLPTKAIDGPAVKADKWTLRGVALVLTTDYAW
jgi:dynein heavy chain